MDKLKAKYLEWSNKHSASGGSDSRIEFEAFKGGCQSRQAEVDFLKAQLGIKTDQIKGFESEIKKNWQAVEEKDKRIEEALYALKGLKAENDLWGCNQVEAQFDVLEKALRGEHE